jgi:hypothetical protein
MECCEASYNAQDDPSFSQESIIQSKMAIESVLGYSELNQKRKIIWLLSLIFLKQTLFSFLFPQFFPKLRSMSPQLLWW